MSHRSVRPSRFAHDRRTACLDAAAWSRKCREENSSPRVQSRMSALVAGLNSQILRSPRRKLDPQSPYSRDTWMLELKF